MKKYKVLLADDEIMIREGFKKLFDWEEHGCEVIGEAADGIAAINAIESLVPDIVLMDINMPAVNGLEVIRREQARFPQMAFVIVSGYDDFNYCREALRLKIVDYILKPVNFDEFGSVIDNLKIKLYQNQADTASGGVEPGTAVHEDQSLIFSITEYIRGHLSDEISLARLAEEFHINANYVSQLFKNEIGVGYLEYLRSMRIEKAKTLLITTDKSVVEISDECGFGDYRVFTKVFKKVTKLTPSQFRK